MYPNLLSTLIARASIKSSSTYRRGFSLIELLVVIAIIAILTSVVGVNVLSQPDKAKVSKAKQDISSIAGALDLYKLDNGDYPSTEQGLQALTTEPEGAANWQKGGYIKGKSSLKDPWNREYIYKSPGDDGRDFDITSLGKDGKAGGEDVNADISNF